MNKKDFTLIKPNIWKHNTEQKYVIDLFLERAAEGKQQITCFCCLFAGHQRTGKNSIY